MSNNYVSCKLSVIFSHSEYIKSKVIQFHNFTQISLIIKCYFPSTAELSFGQKKNLFIFFKWKLFDKDNLFVNLKDNPFTGSQDTKNHLKEKCHVSNDIISILHQLDPIRITTESMHLDSRTTHTHILKHSFLRANRVRITHSPFNDIE